MKNTFIKSIIGKAEIHSKLVFLSVDQQTGFDNELKIMLGNRFIMESISEQYVIGFASGLAADGFLPIIFNHAAFTIRRSYEQILLDCCLQERKVILLGMGGGFATAHLGPSHTTFDDIALARVMPNMEIFVPCGSDDIIKNLDYILNSEHSVYIRLSKYGKNNLENYNETKDHKIMYANFGMDENKICIISTGPISYNVFKAIKETESNILHIHIPFLKNVDKHSIYNLLKNVTTVLIFEEHSIIGGLHSIISEIISSFIDLQRINIVYKGINDIFLHKYGSQEDIWKYLEIDSESIKNVLINLKS